MFCTLYFIYIPIFHYLLSSDFLAGTDTIDDVRIPASFCVLGLPMVLCNWGYSEFTKFRYYWYVPALIDIFGVYLLLTLASIFHVFYEKFVHLIFENAVACVPCFNRGQIVHMSFLPCFYELVFSSQRLQNKLVDVIHCQLTNKLDYIELLVFLLHPQIHDNRNLNEVIYTLFRTLQGSPQYNINFIPPKNWTITIIKNKGPNGECAYSKEDVTMINKVVYNRSLVFIS
jgi:hypothetical protein